MDVYEEKKVRKEREKERNGGLINAIILHRRLFRTSPEGVTAREDGGNPR